MAAESGPLLPVVGRVSKANARQKLSEQLAAVTAIFPAYEDSQPDDPERPPAEPGIGGLRIAGTEKLMLSYYGKPTAATVAGRLDTWLSELTGNLKKISRSLPDVESYSVQVGFPFGVSVSVTFTAGGGGTRTTA